MDYALLKRLDEEDPFVSSSEEEDLNLGVVTKSQIQNSLFNRYRYQGLFKKRLKETSNNRVNIEEGTWPREGSKRGLIMAFASAIFLVTLVISAIFYVSYAHPATLNKSSLDGKKMGKRSISLDDILVGRFGYRTFNGTWISDNEIQYFSENGDLVVYNVTAKNSSVVINGRDIFTNLEGKIPTKVSFSADGNFVLLAYDSQKIFRYSSYAKYMIYDISTSQFHPLESNGHLVQLVEWSPVGNSLVYVKNNNIFHKPSALSTTSSQITFDGSPLVYNGVSDWVYEEEMFNSDKALWISPQGTHLAYIQFNDTMVDLIQFEVYGEPGAPEFQYPMIETIPYPKSGRSNPQVSVNMVRLPLSSNERVNIEKNLQFPEVEKEHLIGGAVWATDSELLIITLNRIQNDCRHHLCNMSGVCQTIFHDDEAKGWIDVEIPKVSFEGRDFITLTSQRQISKSFRHILLYSKNSVLRTITAGDFSIDSILKWDQANGRIFFTAPAYDIVAKKSFPSTLHLYSVGDNGNDLECLSCGTQNSNGDACNYNSFELSTNGGYVAQACSGPSVPEVSIKKILVDSNRRKKDKLFDEKIWVENEDVRVKMRDVAMPTSSTYEIGIEGGLSILARVQLPPFFDETKKYPLLLDVYGGPGSQKITDNFIIDWSDSLITSKGVVYVSIDGRGSGRQSDDLKFQVNRRLGTVEIEDQITGVAWLLKNLPYLDGNRTAIWGWSYGGYATAMVLGTDFKNIFKCGISVAPVTSWRFYDTLYTERYMGLPSKGDNFRAYNESDVTNHIENFKNKKFFLVHGNADDNVHYQQSMVLSRALEKADILFRQQSYPDENHGLGGVRKHLYHSLENFLFTQCF